ncbi:mevalonate kinase [Halotalea alkalilenta]|uniref:mevalonate kinase n=1 Tax=Halotalea alkalilenta TaxID=376489 RepID=UPI0005BD474E|nr:mevalonate kinase [Halotalea alkalilenta]
MEREHLKPLFHAGHGVACGKFILIGEHSVVYGEPAIAMPLHSVRMSARVAHGAPEHWFESELYQGPLARLPAPLAGVKAAIEACLEELGERPEGLHFIIESEVPTERGMGSSAAVAGAVVRALFDLYRRPLDRDTLFALVQVSERIAHGNPSGLDAVATSAAAPIHFQRGEFRDLPIALTGVFVIADTGVKGGTRQTVADLGARFAAERSEVEPRILRLGRLTEEARVCLADDRPARLGELMNEAHAQLATLDISSPELDRLVEAALAHGALGAKLTGGGRGGCMVALCTDAEAASVVAEALLASGARQTWIHRFEEDPA